jgi:broad specificity phosphatase PhoE
MTNIYFIRHAQASYSFQNYDKLSRLGWEQVRILSDYFTNTEICFEAIFTGSNLRQIDTAEAVYSRLKDKDMTMKLNIMPELDEFDIISFLKTYKNDILYDIPSFSSDLDQSILNKQFLLEIFTKALLWSISEKCDASKTETFQTFKDRVCSGLQTIINTTKYNKNVFVVTSGGVLSIVMQMACGLSDQAAIDLVWRFYNTSITLFHARASTLELIFDNRVDHFKGIKNCSELLTHI